MGQIHTLLANRPQGTFPSDAEKNPREQANAKTLRSGTKYNEPKVKITTPEVVRHKEVPFYKEKEEEACFNEEKEKEKVRVNEGMRRYEDLYNPLPFPGRLKKQAEEKH